MLFTIYKLILSSSFYFILCVFVCGLASLLFISSEMNQQKKHIYSHLQNKTKKKSTYMHIYKHIHITDCRTDKYLHNFNNNS
ncbi:hypothetical protein BD408DRAFT_96389 [Parasitella parasitica]|nr:hypothetical protein BD408DRAFT_96389 [Parasitella parasitica]